LVFFSSSVLLNEKAGKIDVRDKGPAPAFDNRSIKEKDNCGCTARTTNVHVTVIFGYSISSPQKLALLVLYSGPVLDDAQTEVMIAYGNYTVSTLDSGG
jgi:hypothetical protein